MSVRLYLYGDRCTDTLGRSPALVCETDLSCNVPSCLTVHTLPPRRPVRADSGDAGPEKCPVKCSDPASFCSQGVPLSALACMAGAANKSASATRKSRCRADRGGESDAALAGKRCAPSMQH